MVCNNPLSSSAPPASRPPQPTTHASEVFTAPTHCFEGAEALTVFERDKVLGEGASVSEPIVIGFVVGGQFASALPDGAVLGACPVPKKVAEVVSGCIDNPDPAGDPLKRIWYVYDDGTGSGPIDPMTLLSGFNGECC